MTTLRRRLAISGALAGALVVLALGGCSLLVDPSGLSDDNATIGGDGSAGGGDGGALADGDAGASSNDGALPDAATDATDAADASKSPCPSFAIFCDDFETGNTLKWSSETAMPNGSVVVVGPGAGAPNPWAGAFALHAYAGMNATPDGGTAPENLAQVRLDIPPILSGTVFVRFYLYLPRALLVNTVIAKLGHQNTTTGPADIQLKVGDMGGTDRFRVTTDNAIANGSDHDAVVPVPVATWTCVELGFTLASAGHLSVWSDGVQVIDAPEDTLGTGTAPYDQLRLGLGASAGTVTQELYADDYVYATQRIGCE